MNGDNTFVNHKECISAAGLYIAGLWNLFPFSPLLLPLRVWVYKRQDSEFINSHEKNVLNFQITIHLVFVVLLVLSLILAALGAMFSGEKFMAIFVSGKITLFILIAGYHLIVMLIGAIKAFCSQRYDIRFSCRFIQ